MKSQDQARQVLKEICHLAMNSLGGGQDTERSLIDLVLFCDRTFQFGTRSTAYH